MCFIPSSRELFSFDLTRRQSRLYIIEGLITVVWAFCCLYLVPKNFETAYFLNDDEKALMRLRAEEMEAYSSGSGHYTMADIKLAAKDIKSWVHGCIQICVVTILYGKDVSELLHERVDADECWTRFRDLPPHHHQGRIQLFHGSGAVSRDSAQRFRSMCVRRRRDLVRQVLFALFAAGNLRAHRDSRIRHSSRPCIRSCQVLRDLPDRHGLLPVHGREYASALNQYH